jgi:hypothetical protein
MQASVSTSMTRKQRRASTDQRERTRNVISELSAWLGVQVVPEVVGRVHALLAGDWDWSGAGGRSSASEEAREQADLQRSYYGFLNALSQNQLLQSLQVRTSHQSKR